MLNLIKCSSDWKSSKPKIMIDIDTDVADINIKIDIVRHPQLILVLQKWHMVFPGTPFTNYFTIAMQKYLCLK
jgi:hypothetical protein